VVSILENATRDRIFYTSFKLFLETGYEATNMRDICNEVGIKASTVYFYYKSKQNLFFYIYDNICMDYLKHIQSIKELSFNIPLKEKLYTLLMKKIEYYASDISKRKFILRYHLFPPEEISKVIREKYKYYINEENKIILEGLNNSVNLNNFYDKIDKCLIEYRKLENHLVYEMITSNVKIEDEYARKLWDINWANIIK
jgi:AcrR family transcriptional regulator